tara:strand:- start:1166 stop:1426 length:261 start_codon:yes stop_codon:yes gene_type:complete
MLIIDKGVLPHKASDGGERWFMMTNRLSLGPHTVRWRDVDGAHYVANMMVRVELNDPLFMDEEEKDTEKIITVKLGQENTGDESNE